MRAKYMITFLQRSTSKKENKRMTFLIFKRVKITTFAAMLSSLCLLAMPTQAQDFDAVDEGMRLLETNDPTNFPKAFETLSSAAESGNPWGQYQVGEMLFEGKGVSQDKPNAAIFYRRAADQGIHWAQYKLGLMLLTGDAVPARPAEAVDLLDKAASQGNIWASYRLGEAYLQGNLITLDLTRAKFYLEKAARLNNSWALLRLGEMYRDGIGVGLSLSDAEFLFEQSASLDNSQAMLALANLIEAKDGERAKTLRDNAARVAQ